MRRANSRRSDPGIKFSDVLRNVISSRFLTSGNVFERIGKLDLGVRTARNHNFLFIYVIAPRLVSELASEGASGRLFSQTQINQNATRFGPI